MSCRLILETQGKLAEAKARYEQILTIDRYAVVAATNLAHMYAEAGEQLDTALQLAQTAKARVPDNATVNDTLGWVYLRKGLTGPRLTPSSRASRRNPRIRPTPTTSGSRT